MIGNVVGNLVGNVVGNLVSGGFDPIGIFGSDLVAWYRADSVTLSEPSPLDPNDLTTANWLRNNTAVVADQYTSTYDSVGLDKVTANAVVANAAYVESAVAIANCNANFPNTVRICRAKYGNHAWIMLGGGTKHAYFNLQTGAIGTVNGGGSATITALGGGEYLCKYFAPAAGVNNKSLVHLVSGDNASINWSPAGTEYIYLGGVYMEQKRVSSWTDLSGNGRHLVNATAATQPSYTGSRLYFLNALSQTMAATVTVTANLPWSVFVVASMDSTGNRGILEITDTGLINRGMSLFHNGGSMYARSHITPAGQVTTSTVYYDSGRHMYSVEAAAALTTGRIDNTSYTQASAASTALVGAPTQFVLSHASAGAFDGSIDEVIVHRATETAAQTAMRKAYLNSRYNLGLT